MPEAVSVLILKAAVVKAVEVMIQKVVNSNWNKQFDEGKEILLELKSDWPRNNYLERHVQSSLKIRTLLNPNDDITLDEIYYPLTLNTASNKDQVVIGDSQTLNFSGAINIIGIAGQGKSTILRKLFLEEIKQAERIPFFIELRNVEDGDILSHFKEVLKSFQIVITDSNVEYLLQSGKVVLLLDGFDEVRQKLATKTLNSIKNIMSSYACPVIITSRPNTEVCTCPGIYNMTVEGINLVDKIRILNIIENRDVNSNSTTFRYLCELLISNNSFAETICNPIMVTLLYHCFPYMDEVPKDISEFYRQLFGVLYARHDRIKGYTTRERESEIDVEPAREFFSLISLKSLIREEYELNSYNLHKYVKSALETGGYNPKKADAFINDLVKITCLLQTDGNDRYVFLHKSVQEFFAAFYISTMQEKYLKEKVYIILRKTVRSSEKLDNLLHFLFHLDKKNFIDEITLETFKESQFKDFADLNYDDFSLPFDRMLKGIFIRGESRKKDYEIILSCHNSMDKILNLSFLNVINGRERTIDGNLELPLLEKLKNGL
ncbi:NACHT domain-containing protein, partial [Yersinia enterocolitica]|nr:NACHT domain-containing protein [Yersinia enterocolitica]